MSHADADRRVAAFVVEQRGGQPVGHDVEHCDRDHGVLAGVGAADQGLEDCRIGGGARGDIDDGNADPRRLRRSSGDRAESGFGLN